LQSAWRHIGGCRYAEQNILCLSDKRKSFVKKSLYITTGYSGHWYELLNQLNTAVISYASVCVLQAGAFSFPPKIFLKSFQTDWHSFVEWNWGLRKGKSSPLLPTRKEVKP